MRLCGIRTCKTPWGAFVSGVRRSDAAVAYLFELDNIFAVCAMFIIWRDIPPPPPPRTVLPRSPSVDRVLTEARYYSGALSTVGV